MASPQERIVRAVSAVGFRSWETSDAVFPGGLFSTLSNLANESVLSNATDPASGTAASLDGPEVLEDNVAIETVAEGVGVDPGIELVGVSDSSVPQKKKKDGEAGGGQEEEISSVSVPVQQREIVPAVSENDSDSGSSDTGPSDAESTDEDDDEEKDDEPDADAEALDAEGPSSLVIDPEIPDPEMPPMWGDAIPDPKDMTGAYMAGMMELVGIPPLLCRKMTKWGLLGNMDGLSDRRKAHVAACLTGISKPVKKLHGRILPKREMFRCGRCKMYAVSYEA